MKVTAIYRISFETGNQMGIVAAVRALRSLIEEIDSGLTVDIVQVDKSLSTESITGRVATETARCQHCPNPADERSYMCTDCASKADTEVQELRDALDTDTEA